MNNATVNPFTGETVRTFPAMSRAEVQDILADAAQAQRDWRATSFASRAVCLRAAARLLEARAADYAALMTLEMGKPFAQGLAEARKCATVCDFYAEQGAAMLQPRNVASDATRSLVRHDPLGVVLAIMPWNFPFWQVFRFAAPTLMAGNGGLLKHAGNVPQCALAIEQLLHDAGFPPALFRTLLIEVADVAGIIADPCVAAVTLTGSEGAGRAVAEAAGRALKPVVLELGGADPFIVLRDADLDAAATQGAAARCLNSGQSCIAAKRFIVEAPVYEAFLSRFTTAMRQQVVGDPLDERTTIGPLARLDLRTTLHRQVTQSVAAGATLHLGGVVPPGPGACYPPTILTDIPESAPAWSDELFGPVAAVFKVADTDAAVALANASRFGLGASVWTRDLALAELLATRLDAGGVFVNGFVKSDPRLPFGGVKDSGFGRELSVEGIHAFVNAKTVWIA